MRNINKNRFSAWLRCSIALAALLAAQTAFAGFDAWGGTGFKIGPLECNPDGSLKDLTEEQKKLVEPLVQQLMMPAAASSAQRYAKDKGLGLSEADAWAKIDCIRKNAKKAATLGSEMLTDAACSKWVLDQAKAGSICVGWGMSVAGTVDIDIKSDEANCTAKKRESEQILLNIEYLLDCTIPCYDSRMLILADFIRHETLHAGQLYKPDATALPADPTPAQVKAGLGKKYACNEIGAHGGGETWQNDMKMILCDPDSYDPTKPLPNANAAIQRTLKALRMVMPKTTRDAEAAKLKRHMQHYANWNKGVKDCYQAAKDAFCAFIADGDKDKLQKVLSDAAWKRYVSWLDHPNFVAIVPPQVISQYSGVQDLDGPDINTGIEIRDFHVRVDGGVPRLLVVGEDPLGFGELQLYFDEDGDTFFDENTKQVLFTGDPRLQDNMQIIHDQNSDFYFIYDSFSTLIYQFIDTDLDLLPDQLGLPINNPDPLMQDYPQFQFDPNAPLPTLIGYPTRDVFAPSLGDGAPLYVMQDFNVDSFFDIQFEIQFDDLIPIQPVFTHEFLLPGAPEAFAYGTLGAPLEVWAIDPLGELIEPLGAGIGQGVSQELLIFFNRPLFEGELIAVIDFEHNSRSFAKLVEFPATPCIADLDGDGLVGSADLAILLGSWGQAGVPADLDGDGFVGSADLAIVLGSWGACSSAPL